MPILTDSLSPGLYASTGCAYEYTYTKIMPLLAVHMSIRTQKLQHDVVHILPSNVTYVV
jgi:hypothetical protein